MQVYSYTDTQIYSIYKKSWLTARKTIITLKMCSGRLCDARKIHIIIICLFQERWNLCGAREHDMARMLHKDDNCKTTWAIISMCFVVIIMIILGFKMIKHSYLQLLWMRWWSQCWRPMGGPFYVLRWSLPAFSSSSYLSPFSLCHHHYHRPTRLSHSIIFADQLKAKNQGDKVRGGDLNLLDFLTHFCSHHCRHHLCHRLHDQDYFWRLTVPAAILLLLTVLACLFFTRHDSLCCQVTLYWIYMKSIFCHCIVG